MSICVCFLGVCMWMSCVWWHCMPTQTHSFWIAILLLLLFSWLPKMCHSIIINWKQIQFQRNKWHELSCLYWSYLYRSDYVDMIMNFVHSVNWFKSVAFFKGIFEKFSSKYREFLLMACLTIILIPGIMLESRSMDCCNDFISNV